MSVDTEVVHDHSSMGVASGVRSGGSAPSSHSSGTPTLGWQHVVAVGWTVLLAAVVLGPALAHGGMFGPYGLLSHSGLTARAGVVAHGNTNNSDAIVEMIPWTQLDWTQVHSGVLPLWNPSNGLGMPLAFNWQSAAFGVPSLVGYLVPLRFAYTAGAMLTLIIAGSGAYVAGRALRLSFLGAVMTATVFELSGPMVAWLGYPAAQVMAWGGWVLAATVLVLRGNRRVPSVVFLALVVACAIYSGFPETLIVMTIATFVFAVVVLVSRALSGHLGFPGGPVVKPAIDLAAGVIAGGALGAPLVLPSLQLTAGSLRATAGAYAAPPVHDTLYLAFAGFDGAPVPRSYAFSGGSFFYNETAVYVGIIALVLALLGVGVAVRRHRAEIVAITVVGVACGALAYLGPVAHLADDVPGVGDVNWLRALMPLALVVAVLAGVGATEFARPRVSRAVRSWLVGGFSAAALVLAGIWVVGRGGGLPSFGRQLAVHVRAESFVWPAVGVGVGLAGALILYRRARWGRAVAVAMIAGEALFLVTAGSVLTSWSPDGAPPTPAVRTLQGIVGDARVGAGPGASAGPCALGVGAEANLLYGTSELDLYDPIVPKSYFSTWKKFTRTSGGETAWNHFCPTITTVGEARLLGASYVLELTGQPGPPGSRFVKAIKVANPDPGDLLGTPPPDEALYRIPDSTVATLSSAGSNRPGSGVPLTTVGANPAQLRIVTRARTEGTLRVRVTDVPGWQASIDGRPLSLGHSSVFEVTARIPSGRHVITLRYWPAAFTVGLVIAVVGVLALAGALVLDLVARRRYT